MLESSDRERPCRAFACWLSFARVTTSVPSARSIVTSSWKLRLSSPFGPFTTTSLPLSFTSTPEGTGIGSFRIRLIPTSPQVRQALAAGGLLPRLAAGHETGGGGHDRDAQAAKDPRHLGFGGIDAEAGTADAPDTRHRRRLA